MTATQTGVAVAAASMHVPDGESGAVALLRCLLITGRLAAEWGLPPISRWEPEYRFPRGRADLVLFHDDGSVTVVEVKDAGDDRHILSGVGQLSLYAMQVRMALPDAKVRRILAAPVDGSRSRHLLAACDLAGVVFEPLGPLAEHRAAVGARNG